MCKLFRIFPDYCWEFLLASLGNVVYSKNVNRCEARGMPPSPSSKCCCFNESQAALIVTASLLGCFCLFVCFIIRISANSSLGHTQDSKSLPFVQEISSCNIIPSFFQILNLNFIVS